jgi:glycosyltransferase involved in cell wall biosynthesis
MAEAIGLGDRCQFLGALPMGTVYREMAAAAVQVSPSLYEAFGLVNVEANSVGTPVIASDTGGIREVIVDGETGFLFPPGDSSALEERIVRLLGDEELREKMGRVARKRFEDNFSMRQMPRQADFFERLVGRP